MGSRYLVIPYMFFEHHPSRGEYRRFGGGGTQPTHAWRAGRPSMVARASASGEYTAAADH